MEHPCPKCGALVTDGLPFCAQCKSPQIRVPGLEVDTQAADASASVERPVGQVIGRAFPAPLQQNAVFWHLALPAAAFGGLVSIAAMLATALVFGPGHVGFAVAGLAFGGGAAVFIYRLRTRNSRLTPAMGAKIGAASAGFGFAILAIVMIATCVYNGDELRKILSDALTQASAAGSDPQAVQRSLELLKTEEGLGAIVALLLSVTLVIFVTASSIGGALCAWWLRRR